MEAASTKNSGYNFKNSAIYLFINKHILLAGTKGLAKDKLKTVKLINTVSAITAFLAITVGFVFYIFTGLLKEIFIPASIEGLLFMSVIFFNSRRLYSLASLSVLIIHLMCAIYFAAMLGSLINVPIIVAFLFGLSPLLYAGKVKEFLAMTAIAVTLFIIEFNAFTGFVKPLEMPIEDQHLFRWIALVCFLGFHASIIKYYQQENKSLFNQIEDFLKNVAHDLGTILSSNYLALNSLKAEANKPVPNMDLIRTYIGELSVSNGEMSIMVNSVLDVTNDIRAGINCNETLSLEDAIKNVIVGQTHSAMARGIKITSTYSPSMPEYIKSDLTRLTTVLNNLVSNAIKYSNEHTTIQVKVLENGNNFTIAVTNQCPPIPPKKLVNLFGEYVRGKTNKDTSGSGLGLYFVKKVVNAFNGTYGVTSNEIETTFHVTLPLIHGEKLEIFDNTRNNEKQTDIEIYYADDNIMFNMRFGASLRDLGYKTTSCQNGSELLTKLETIQKMPDCIITDDLMDEMDGYHLLINLKKDERFRTIPVIALSGTLDPKRSKKLLGAGAVALFSKPSSGLEMQIIKEAIDQHVQKAHADQLANQSLG